MQDFLSLHDADQIAEEAAEPAVHPGLAQLALGVLRHPHETLSQILAHPIDRYATVLAAGGGIYWALNFAIYQAGGESMRLPVLLAAVVLAGIPLGIAYLYAAAILINWASEILGGQPERRRIRMAFALAGLPGILALVLVGIPRVAIYGQALFTLPRTWVTGDALIWALWFGDAIAFAWSLLIVLKGVKIINHFSTARGLAALLLPMGPVLLIGLLFAGIAFSGAYFAPAW